MRSGTLLAAVLLLSPLAACKKASPEDCRKAILNVQKIRNISDVEHDPEPDVRKCRATANPATVECLIKAKTEADVDTCEGKKPGK